MDGGFGFYVRKYFEMELFLRKGELGFKFDMTIAKLGCVRGDPYGKNKKKTKWCRIQRSNGYR